MKIKSEPVENKKYAKQIEQADEFLVNNNFQGSILISQKNKIIFAKGYGISDKKDNSNPQNSINTVYEIGSITKQITAAAIMQLIEKNKISLSSPLAKALIGKEIGDVAEFRAPSGNKSFEIIDIQYI